MSKNLIKWCIARALSSTSTSIKSDNKKLKIYKWNIEGYVLKLI